MHRALKPAGLLILAFCLTGLMAATGHSEGSNADKQQLHSLIAEYFASWSKPDMAAYKGCFHPMAAIYFIDDAGNPHYAPLDKFIASQEKFHQTFRGRPFEKPTHISLTVNGRLAQATVRWELHKGNTVVTGTDYFMFSKTGAGWRILSLAFEQDKK